MTTMLSVHPDNPQSRLIKRVVAVIEQGGVIVYPTDSDYALGCELGNKTAIERIRRIRRLGRTHHFTLLCRDLSEIATYARIDNSVFRFLKAYTPGPYTFILPATRVIPRQLQHPKRKTIGIRIPANQIAMAILTELNRPLMNVSLILPDEEWALSSIKEIEASCSGQVDLIVNGGPGAKEPTTVIDLTSGVPEIIRKGLGDISDI